MGYGSLPLDWGYGMKPAPAPPKNKLILKDFTQRCSKCDYAVSNIKFSHRMYDVDKVQEYLKAKCSRCDYQWNMRTADGKNKPVSLKGI